MRDAGDVGIADAPHEHVGSRGADVLGEDLSPGDREVGGFFYLFVVPNNHMQVLTWLNAVACQFPADHAAQVMRDEEAVGPRT